MNVTLFPRLTPAGVHTLLSMGDKLTPSSAKAFLDENSAMTSVAPSGGSKRDDAAWEIGKLVRETAHRCGFPDNPSNVAKAKFDREVAILLATLDELQTGEALRDDVWSYASTVVLPDIVAWRFANKSHDRFAGGVRNTFQRLWIRGTTLDRGVDHSDRWELVRSLSEDAAVQIFERPAISAHKSLASTLAEGWLVTSTKLGRQRMEPIMRCATKILRLRNETIDITALTQEEITGIVFDCFSQATISANNHELPS